MNAIVLGCAKKLSVF